MRRTPDRPHRATRRRLPSPRPPIELFEKSQEESDPGAQEELKANAQKLVDTLESFGVRTRVLDISRGPSVTRYELQPMAGVKISRITSLADDIALNLAVADVRMEAPIPGKPAVGIEVPGIEVRLTLGDDGRYTLDEQYIDRDTRFHTAGRYTVRCALNSLSKSTISPSFTL